MSVFTFLASDHPLPPAAPPQNYPLEIDVDSGTIFDGGADDNFFLLPFADVQSYTHRKHGVSLQWHYTKGRAERILQYMADALVHAETIEFWHVWLMGYWEYEDRPVVRRYTASIAELTAEDIRELDKMEIWNNPDKNRPSFYCLTIHR